MTYIRHFQHGSPLSWNRDFLKLNDKTGEVSSVRLNLLQRILRLTLGNLASSLGIDAFYAKTIFSQKRITPFERTGNSAVATKVDTLIHTLNFCGKKLSYTAPHFNPFELPPAPTDSQDNHVQGEDLSLNPIPNQQIVGSTYLKKRFVDSCYADVTELLINTKDQGVIFRGFEKLLKNLVKYDIEATKKAVIIAKQKASELTETRQNNLLREIAKVEAVYDLESAKQTTAGISERFERISTLIHIAFDVEKDLPRAIELALAYGGLKGDYLILDIVKREAETDIAGAQETLQKIQNPYIRSEAKIEIIKRLALTDMPEARRLTAELEDPHFRFQAELALAQHDPQHNFQPAIATALTIEREDEIAWLQALAKIAVMQNKFDKNGAQKTLALMEKNHPQQNMAREELEKQEARDNMNTALERLKHMAQKNMWEAKTVAHSFQDLEERVTALCELAEFALEQK